MSLQLISANHASAAAVTLAARANRKARGFCGGVYPITPQTECIERLCEQEIERRGRARRERAQRDGRLHRRLAGARSFTASSSNGLAYMAENVPRGGLLPAPDRHDGREPHSARRGTSGWTTATR